MHTIKELQQLKSMSFGEKVNVSQTRIMEWYVRHNNKCYVSFSGGKDSTVLAYITAQVCVLLNCKLVLWFSDTGLEYPEVREHVKTYADFLKERFPELEVETIIEYPRVMRGADKGKRITFKYVINKYGYPVISKEVSKTIKDAQNALKKGNTDSYALCLLNGEKINPHTGGASAYNKKKYKYLLNAPFKISNECCDAMKKRPSHIFNKKSGLFPILGTMTDESRFRLNVWLKNGCNAFEAQNPSSTPLAFWNEQDILRFIKKYELPIPSIYGEIIEKNDKLFLTGINRTGCIFCMFGSHMEKEPNRFQRLKETHPKLWRYGMKPVEDGGLGLKTVLDFIGVKSE